MMLINQFPLDEYYNNNMYTLLYLDELLNEYIKTNKIAFTKEAFLETLGINPSSYRRSRAKEQKIGKSYCKILLNLFKINELVFENKLKYEQLFNDVYNQFYYKTGDLNELESRIISFINDNTILNPLFNIILYIVRFQKHGNPTLLLESNKFIYEYLNKFNDNFYISTFRDLKLLIDINYLKDTNELIKYNNILESSNKKGLLYYIFASKARLSKRYDLSIIYAKKSIEFLMKDFNFYRLCHINIQLCSSLEALNMYEEALEIAKSQYISLSTSKLFENDILPMRAHYLTCLLGLKRYNEIVDYFCNESIHNYKTFIYYLLATYKLDKNKYQEALEYNKNKINYETSQFDYHIEEIINFLSNNKKNYNIIKNSSLNEGLINVICSDY